ncbi:LOW QUALITY PROTEIN: tektin bundle-interacting protein 1 [Gavia stellata]|uniref:LOW QUALITY PROTEIN: tektin bundle-interacting protein 1 n=1 Tax=Gavia stellata TaxID=37040 RepID=UPI00289B6EA7|nr:LOW QUALITY PROTEIN: tektin bundle-interacting protein 1 [Gavia stellata]
MELGEHSTLEREVVLPLCSNQHITLRGLRQAPLLKQAVPWKTTPLGWDAVGQSWSMGLSGRGEEAEDPLYPLASRTAHRCWQGPHILWGERDPLPQRCSPPSAYAQRLWAVAWWDPLVPAVYLGPCTPWGPFLWRERPVLGKDPWVLGGSSGYVPVFSCPPNAWDISTWSLLYHQPSTYQ